MDTKSTKETEQENQDSDEEQQQKTKTKAKPRGAQLPTAKSSNCDCLRGKPCNVQHVV